MNMLKKIVLLPLLLIGCIHAAEKNAITAQPAVEITPIQLSLNCIEEHKKNIEKIIYQRKWGRRVLRIVQTGTTLLTIGELVIFVRDFMAACNGEAVVVPKDENDADKQKNKKLNIGLLLGRAAIVTGAQTLTAYLIRRYYENVMQEESISWFIFTHAFYKVSCAEVKRQVIALQESKDTSNYAYHKSAIISSTNGLIKEMEKIIAFMEYKIERMPIKNRPEARSLANYFTKSASSFAESMRIVVLNNFEQQQIVLELGKVESIIDRELLHFARLEGSFALSEQQYNALLQSQGV